jgi:hypothetical protein
MASHSFTSGFEWRGLTSYLNMDASRLQIKSTDLAGIVGAYPKGVMKTLFGGAFHATITTLKRLW